jgi:hypothetical protein
VSGGVATFGDLVLTAAGSYTLGATATGRLAGPGSASFAVSPAAADHLAFDAEPGGGVAGQPLSPAVRVQVFDRYGNLLTGDNTDQIGLTIASGPGGFAAGSALTAGVSAGVASFSSLVLTTAGTYTLQAASGGLPPITTSAFLVAPGKATHLVVTNPPPAGVTAGSGFGLTVAAEDAEGNVDTSFNGSVTLTPAGNSGGSPLTTTAVNGVATFSGLTLNNPGSGYALQVTAGGLAGVTSSPISVASGSAPPTALPPLTGDVSGQVTATLTPAPRTRKGKSRGNTAILTVHNNSAQALQGPLNVLLRGLKRTVKLRGAAGYVGIGKKKSPFVTINVSGGTLPSQESVSMTLQFSGRPNAVALSVFANAVPK